MRDSPPSISPSTLCRRFRLEPANRARIWAIEGRGEPWLCNIILRFQPTQPPRARIDMARYDFRSPRLFVAHPLSAGATVPLDPAQGRYLAGVLRLAAGDRVLAFNGTDGEWQCAFAPVGKKSALQVEHQVRPQTPPGDLHYLFAPLKRARLDYMVQKAVEMGVSRLQPVTSRHTQAERINLERMR